jgi:hypothetical protein
MGQPNRIRRQPKRILPNGFEVLAQREKPEGAPGAAIWKTATGDFGSVVEPPPLGLNQKELLGAAPRRRRVGRRRGGRQLRGRTRARGTALRGHRAALQPFEEPPGYGA